VAVGDPLLALRAHAGVPVVLAVAPDGVGVAQPERRGPGAGSEVDEGVGLSLRMSPISWMAAAKSLSKRLPGNTLLTLPVPSNLNWLTPSLFRRFITTSWKRW